MAAITIGIDPAKLTGYTDQFLSTAWHVAQVNPAPHGDRAAGELVQNIGWEIIRRWLGKVPAELHHHQPHSYYWDQLRRVARFTPAEGHHGGFTAEQRALWDAGTWSVRPEAAAALQPGIAEVVAKAIAWRDADRPGSNGYLRKHQTEQALVAALDALRRPRPAASGAADDGTDAAQCPPADPGANLVDHRHVGGSAGGPGENSAQCACGVVFDGFDTHTDVMAVLDAHIEARPAAPAAADDGAGEPTGLLDPAVTEADR